MQEPTAPDARPQWPNGANGDPQDTAPAPASVWPPMQLWEGGNSGPADGSAGEDPGNAGRRHLSALFRRRSDGGAISDAEAAEDSTSPNLMRPPTAGPPARPAGSARAPQPPAGRGAQPGPRGGGQHAPPLHPGSQWGPEAGPPGPAPDHRPPPAGYTEAPTGEFPRWGTGLVPQMEQPQPAPPPGPQARPTGPHPPEAITDRTLPRMNRQPPAVPADEARAPGERDSPGSRAVPPGLTPPDGRASRGEQPTGVLPTIGGPPNEQPTEPRPIAQGRFAVPPPSRNGHPAARGPGGATPGVNGAPREIAGPREVSGRGAGAGPGQQAPGGPRSESRPVPARDARGASLEPSTGPGVEPPTGPAAPPAPPQEQAQFGPARRAPASPERQKPAGPQRQKPAGPPERQEPAPPHRGFADPLADPLPDDVPQPPRESQQEPPRVAGADTLLSGPALSWSDLMRQDAETAPDPAPDSAPDPEPDESQDAASRVVPRQFAGAPRPQPPQQEDQDAPGPEQAAPGEPEDPDAEFTATATIYQPAAEPPYQPDADSVLTAVRELPGVRGAELVGEPGQQQVLRLDLVGAVDPHVVGRQAAELLRDRLGVHAAVRARSQQLSEQARLFPEPHRAPDEQTQQEGGRRSRRHGTSFNAFGEVSNLPVSVEQVQVVTAGLEAAVEVGLAIGGVRVAGRASGPAQDWHVLRAAVTATIEALGMLLAGRARLALEYAELVSAGPAKVAVVSLLWLSSAGSERIAGAAPVAGEPPDAAVLATIAAVRGQVPDLLGHPAIEP